MATTTAMVLITGNTYPVKEQIKAMGGRWDADAKGWRVPADKAEEAMALVSATPKQPKKFTPRKCCNCGGPVRPGYFKCRDCYYHDKECDEMGLDRNWDA